VTGRFAEMPVAAAAVARSPGVNVIKHFFVFVTDAPANQARVFSSASFFQASLTFAGKLGSLLYRHIIVPSWSSHKCKFGM
jgi:hypothetical protein